MEGVDGKKHMVKLLVVQEKSQVGTLHNCSNCTATTKGSIKINNFWLMFLYINMWKSSTLRVEVKILFISFKICKVKEIIKPIYIKIR